ncbi:MAG TPA: hypothetical protein VF625_06955, partial [Longimicrobium sp.]
GLLTLTGELVPGTPIPDVMPIEGTIFVLPSSADPEAIVRRLTGQPDPEPEAEQDAPPAS